MQICRWWVLLAFFFNKGFICLCLSKRFLLGIEFDWEVFPPIHYFQNAASLYCHLHCMWQKKNCRHPYLCSSLCDLFIFFSVPYVFITVVEKLNYDVLWCCFIHDSCACDFFSTSWMSVYSFHQIWKYLAIISSNMLFTSIYTSFQGPKLHLMLFCNTLMFFCPFSPMFNFL